MQLTELFGSRRVNDETEMWVVVGRGTVDMLKSSGLYEELINKGIKIYNDGCILEYKRENFKTEAIMSDSRKFSTYYFGMKGIQPIF